jgi:hypothetical protein
MNTVKSALQNDSVTLHTLLRIQERMVMLSQLRRKDSENRSPHSPLRIIRKKGGQLSRFCCLAMLALMACVASGKLTAQSTFGSLRGSALDPAGSAIPGATITLVGLDDNSQHKAISGDTGGFEFENLKPGRYQVLGEAHGFADAKLAQVVLEARQDLRITLTFAIAGQTQTVEVSAAGEMVNTENGTLNHTISNEDLKTLPMNSRSVSSSPLAALAASPEVTRDSQGNIAVGGATAAQSGFSVDGISTANIRYNGALQDTYPSLESIDEMKVTAFDNNAEFAQMGDVTFTTKSGTTQWHGSAFEYFQDSAMDATVLNFPVKAPRTFNTFGGSFGGPVTIPKLYEGRDRTFFFADYEGNRKTQSYPEELLVPSAADWAGNLSDLVQSVGAGAVMDPFTGNPYPNNTIPGAPGNPCGSSMDCINPVAQALEQYYPLPNANLGVVGPSYNYLDLVPNPANSNGFDVRVDHSFSSKQQVFVRYSFKNAFYSEFNSAGVIAPASDFLPNVGANEQNRSMVASYNYAITSSLVNEFRFGFANYNENDSFPIEGATAISQLGLVFDHPVGIAAHPTADAFPTFDFSDGSVTNIGQDKVGTTISGNMQFTDNVTKVIGKHTLRFGFDARREHFNSLMYFAPSDDFGQFTFSGGWTGYSFGDFLLGMPGPSYFAVIGPQMDARSVHWGVYGQDTWQVNRHLTANFGLRWELLPPFVESNGDIATYLISGNNLTVVVPDKFPGFIANNTLLQQINTGFLQGFNACSLNTGSPLPCSNVETASQAGLPQGLRDWNWHDYDPRVSFAYRPFSNDKTVIRAGFGIYTMTTLGPMSFNSGIIALSDLLTYNNSLPSSSGFFQFPNTSPPNAAAAIGGGDFEEANDPHWKDPASAQWNLTLERELTPNTVVKLSYTGQGAYHLPITVDNNQIPASTTPYTVPNNGYSVVDPRSPFQNWLLLMESDSIGTQNYESGIAEVAHKEGHGLTFQASYTFAKNISDAQGTDAPSVTASEEPYAVEIANKYDIKADRGNVVATPRQRFMLSGTYQLPFGKGKTLAGPRLLNPVIEGWNLSTVTTMQTGEWLTPTMPPADDQSNTNMIERASGGAIARPDCVGNPIPSNRSSANFYNLNAFAVPPMDAGRFGTCGVGILEGPGMIDVDAGLAKRFNVGERMHLRFEASFTNVINHSNYAPPSLNLGEPSTFGVLNTALLQGQGGNRTGQVALRFDF